MWPWGPVSPQGIYCTILLWFFIPSSTYGLIFSFLADLSSWESRSSSELSVFSQHKCAREESEKANKELLCLTGAKSWSEFDSYMQCTGDNDLHSEQVRLCTFDQIHIHGT